MSLNKSAPELPEEKPVQPEDEVIKLEDDGQLDDNFVEAMEEVSEPEEVSDEVNTPPEELSPAEEATPDTPAPSDEGLAADDPVVDKAIDEIVAEDSDAVLAAEDETRAGDEPPVPLPKAESRVGAFLRSIWQDPLKRKVVVTSFAVLVLALALIPHSRYFILNTARVRASMELRVVDSGTLQPLKNVTVKAGGAEATTDSDGVAKLEKVRLGRTTLTIQKRAFAPLDRSITVGWGSNPLGEFRAIAIGTQYTFYAKDAFSGQPIARAEAMSGDGNAIADDDGKLVLTLDTAELEDSAQVSVDITAEHYRKETINITVNNREAQGVDMVPSRRHVFVSKRSGEYDVYTVDADGKNETRILSGMGYERDDITLVPHPSDHFAAYVATRENTRNRSGYLLSTLYILDTETGEPVKIDQSEKIQVIGWSSKGRLVYVKIASGASGTDPKRHRLISFNNEDHADSKELASSNSFNDVILADDRVYYAPSNVFQETSPAAYSVSPDGHNQQKILDKEVFTILRTSYDTLYLSAGEEWYSYILGSPLAASSSAPGSQHSRTYLDNPQSNLSLWVDERDGKGVLLSYDKGTKEEKVLAERSGLKLPVYWLNEKYVVFRVTDGRETADYMLNIEGGEAHKITDVTNTAGITRWIYY